jgi:hypothetical protein
MLIKGASPIPPDKKTIGFSESSFRKNVPQGIPTYLMVINFHQNYGIAFTLKKYFLRYS